MNDTKEEKMNDDLDLEQPMLNPFVHHLELKTTNQKIKAAIFTVILLPIRVVCICLFLIGAWLVACIGLYGLTEEDLRTKPLSGWRKKLIPIMCFMGRGVYLAAGLLVVVKGRRATRKEAPILTMAPHSTFIDGSIIFVLGFPSIICRREDASPYVGKLINYTQPLYVWRDDPDSRQNTIKEIIARASSDLDWPQILIFPEGTCTNRTCLITFKSGAFYPGLPVQPVCIRYPNEMDTVTWTWEGPSALKLIWLTLTQPYNICEIEFLPVYYPSEAERKNPKLYANNVRAVMAKALGVPVLDYSYDDCKLMTRAKQMNLPNKSSILEVQKLRHKLGLDSMNVEEKLVGSSTICKDCSKISYSEFVNLLNVDPNNALARQLFKLYDKNNTGVIDFREYLLGVLALSNNRTLLETVEAAFKIYDQSDMGQLFSNEAVQVFCHTLALQKTSALDLFHHIRNQYNTEFITFGHFKRYARDKQEFAYLYGAGKEQKFSSRNGAMCPTIHDEKKRD